MGTKAQKKNTGVWYKDGLQFTCTRCGKCCRDREDPTFVFLEEDDVQRLSECLSLSPKQVLQRYCTWNEEDGYVLNRKPGSCVFYDGRACSGFGVPARGTMPALLLMNQDNFDIMRSFVAKIAVVRV